MGPAGLIGESFQVMGELQFCVDDKLRIVSFGERCGGSSGLLEDHLFGKTYDHLLPKLVHNDQDALEWVLQTGEEVFLKQVALGESIQPAVELANLQITPLQEKGIRSGVRVIITPCAGKGTEITPSALRRSEELEKLVVMLSHGVRNPLNAIKGAVSYLQSRYADEPELGEFTGIMSEEIARLERFVSGFLATSCFDQSTALVDINALLKKILVFNSLQARTAGVELSLEQAPVKPLLVNTFQIEQAIVNLLNNAIAALPAGGRICLACRLVQRRGAEFVELSVSDNGPGIPQAKIDALNDPASEPERGRERGFGLFITREVVHAYNGLMEIEGSAGKGTVVRLLFPPAGESEPA